MFHEVLTSLTSAKTSLNSMKTRLLTVLLRRRVNRYLTELKSRAMIRKIRINKFKINDVIF